MDMIAIYISSSKWDHYHVGAQVFQGLASIDEKFSTECSYGLRLRVKFVGLFILQMPKMRMKLAVFGQLLPRGCKLNFQAYVAFKWEVDTPKREQ